MTPVLKWFENAYTVFGRALESVLTGESSFKVHSHDFLEGDLVQDTVKGKLLQDQVRIFLAGRFSMVLRDPLVLGLFTDGEVNWNSLMYQMNGTMGRYQSTYLKGRRVHCVYVLKGLTQPRFKSILAHEYTHAFTREQGILKSNKLLREGLARWIEYKVLLREGQAADARRISQSVQWIYGKGLRRVLDLEDRVGEGRVVQEMLRIP